MKTRNQMPISRIRSFDLDEDAVQKAEIINNLWEWKDWEFRSFSADCNELNFLDGGPFYSDPPEIIINTSTEHMDNSGWWDNVPEGRMVVVQNADLDIEDHVNKVDSIDELKAKFPMAETLFAGELSFDYGNESSFKRFMLIGRR